MVRCTQYNTIKFYQWLVAGFPRVLRFPPKDSSRINFYFVLCTSLFYLNICKYLNFRYPTCLAILEDSVLLFFGKTIPAPPVVPILLLLLATNLMISHEWVKDQIALDFNIFWIFIYYIVHRKSKNEIIACQCFNIGYHGKYFNKSFLHWKYCSIGQAT